jgi:hypothetical protein
LDLWDHCLDGLKKQDQKHAWRVEFLRVLGDKLPNTQSSSIPGLGFLAGPAKASISVHTIILGAGVAAFAAIGAIAAYKWFTARDAAIDREYSVKAVEKMISRLREAVIT